MRYFWDNACFGDLAIIIQLKLQRADPGKTWVTMCRPAALDPKSER
jgi:hypothetical protein